VVPGGEQTATVRSTPGFQVTVNPRYADGRMGNAYGGLAVAQTIGPDGAYTLNWQVAGNAPLGQAAVLAGAASTSGPRQSGTASAPFRVAARC
jgi:hypothetical protein